MFVLCVGMYRAGSTWQYDIVASLVERYRGGKRLGFIRGEEFALLEDSDDWQVLKSHDAHPAFAHALAQKKAIGVYAHRDLRDVAFSLMHKFSRSFHDVVDHDRLLHACIDNDRFWHAQPDMLIQRYDEITSNSAAALHALAGHIGVSVSADEERALGAEYSLEANRQRMKTLIRHLRADGIDLADPANALEGCATTLVHWNHIREDQSAGWRQLTKPVERGILAAATAEWLVERGYEKDLSWLLDVFKDLRIEIEKNQSELRALQEQLAPVKGLGPGSIRLARFAHRLGSKYPRLKSLAKAILGRFRAHVLPSTDYSSPLPTISRNPTSQSISSA